MQSGEGRVNQIVTVPAKNPNVEGLRANPAKELLAAFLSGKSPNTLAAYRTDLEVFQEFVGAASLDGAVIALTGRAPGEANHLALTYRTRLLELGLSPATINRRLASLRSIVKLARTLGHVAWVIEIPNVKSRSYRDTRGPGQSSVESTLTLLERRGTPKAIRDIAMVYLFSTLALRVSELTGLDYESLDLPGKRVSVLGKGRTEPEFLSLPEPTIVAIEAWLSVRGRENGPLFTNFARATKGSGRLTRNGVYKIIQQLGIDVGVEMRPHGLRHTAITEGIKAAMEHSISLRDVLQFSRHSSLSTLQVYADAQLNIQGKLAGLVAGGLRAKDTPNYSKSAL